MPRRPTTRCSARRRPTRSWRGGTARRTGDLYAFDRPNARIVAVGKADGAYHAQYRLAGGVADWSDLRAMYVIPGIEDAPATLVWLSRDGVHQAVLEAVPDNAPAARRRPRRRVEPGLERPHRAGPASPKPTKKP